MPKPKALNETEFSHEYSHETIVELNGGEESALGKRKRGRPAKPTPTVDENGEPIAKKKRGRPPLDPALKKRRESTGRPRGRPPKDPATRKRPIPGTRPRGRPPSSSVDKTLKSLSSGKSRGRAPKVPKESEEYGADDEELPVPISFVKQRSRPPMAKDLAKAMSDSSEDDEPEPQYYNEPEPEAVEKVEEEVEEDADEQATDAQTPIKKVRGRPKRA